MHPIEQFFATLVPGQLCNVESNPNRKPFMRVVTKVERVTKRGRAWVRWHWVPGEAEPADHIARRGIADCGYAGAAICDGQACEHCEPEHGCKAA